MSFDTRCHELAVVFLEDNPVISTPENADKLAQRIQDAIEEFLLEKEN